MYVKRMLYCPGSGQELLSAFGVTMECHDSSVFLIRKLHAFVDYGGVVKVNGMVMGPCMVRNSGAFSRCFYIS